MEKIDIRSSSSVAKLVGTMTAISRAMVFTLYQGPIIFHAIGSSDSPNRLSLLQSSKWIFGGLLITSGLICGCLWSVLQTTTAREYPDQQIIVFFYCLLGTIQCIALSPFVRRNRSAWILQRGTMVTAVVLGAIYSTVICNSILTWCLRKKGPVFTSAFSPLSIIFGVIMGVTFLSDSLRLGSVIGAMIISTGFYMIIWGQNNENKNILVINRDDMDVSEEPGSSEQTANLLLPGDES